MDPAVLDAAFRALSRRDQMSLLRKALLALPGRKRAPVMRRSLGLPPGASGVFLSGLSQEQREALMAATFAALSTVDWHFFAASLLRPGGGAPEEEGTS
jgi:hypothetical protein